MKKLQNNFTTPEQSKRLLGLGVPADSADCAVHTAHYDNNIEVLNCGYIYTKWINEIYGNQMVAPYLPCWSVGRLMEVLRIVSPMDTITCEFSPQTTVDHIVGWFESDDLDFSKLEE